MECLLAAICRAAEVGMRSGVPLGAYLRQFRGTKFDPAGPTGDQLVPECSSLLDYVARSVEARTVGAWT